MKFGWAFWEFLQNGVWLGALIDLMFNMNGTKGAAAIAKSNERLNMNC